MAAPDRAAAPSRPALIRIGEIVGAHGLRGEVRLRSFAAEPADIKAYSPLLGADGARICAIEALRPSGGAPDLFVARLAGIASRDAAEALAGTALHVARERLLGVLGEEEFLHADLIGCRVETEAGKLVGEIASVQNFGAGDLIEIALVGSRRTELLPFLERFVPLVDLGNRRVVVSADPTEGG
jgi:16S rRNA processing protein RimM